MEDTRRGKKNRAPMKESQRVVTLSPGNESYNGPQYAHMPAMSGEVPRDNAGFFPEGHSEVSDTKFRSEEE